VTRPLAIHCSGRRDKIDRLKTVPTLYISIDTRGSSRWSAPSLRADAILPKGLYLRYSLSQSIMGGRMRHELLVADLNHRLSSHIPSPDDRRVPRW